MCLTRMEELESCLSGLLSTLKKNREHVPLEVLKTQYKQPYEELVRNINLTASAYAKSVLLHRLVLNPDADVEEQCTVINQMIQTSGMLKKISSCMSKTYDVGQIYPLILELRHMVEQALWPYVCYTRCPMDLEAIIARQLSKKCSAALRGSSLLITSTGNNLFPATSSAAPWNVWRKESDSATFHMKRCVMIQAFFMKHTCSFSDWKTAMWLITTRWSR